MEKLTIKEVAAKYGITVTAVRHWLSNGLPWEWEEVRQIGKKKRIMIKESDLDKWLKS